MDLLATLIGSRVRGDALAALFGPTPHRSSLSDLGRAIGHPHQVVERQLRVLVETGLVRVQLADLVGRECLLECVSVREWVTRLEKGDVELRRARRARKLWILGSWEDLLAGERAVLGSKRDLHRAIASWREELSDDWYDSWDPFHTPSMPAP